MESGSSAPMTARPVMGIHRPRSRMSTSCALLKFRDHVLVCRSADHDDHLVATPNVLGRDLSSRPRAGVPDHIHCSGQQRIQRRTQQTPETTAFPRRIA